MRSADASVEALAETLGKLAADRSLLAGLRAASAGARDGVRQSRQIAAVSEVYRAAMAATTAGTPQAVPRTLADIPTAPGRVPVLGHGLRALSDAPGFVGSLPALGPIVRVHFGRQTGYVLTTPTCCAKSTSAMRSSSARTCARPSPISRAARSMCCAGPNTGCAAA